MRRKIRRAVGRAQEFVTKPTHECTLPELIGRAPLYPLEVMERCKQEFEHIDLRYHAQLYQLIAAAYAVGREFWDNNKLWRRFVRELFPEYRGKKLRPIKDARRSTYFVMMYVFGGFEGKRYDRAYKYTRVVEYYFAIGVRVTHIAEQLKADGGVEKVYRRATKQFPRRKKRKQGESVADDGYFADLRDLDDETADASPQGSGRGLRPASVQQERPLVEESDTVPDEVSPLVAMSPGSIEIRLLEDDGSPMIVMRSLPEVYRRAFLVALRRLPPRANGQALVRTLEAARQATLDRLIIPVDGLPQGRPTSRRPVKQSRATRRPDRVAASRTRKPK